MNRRKALTMLTLLFLGATRLQSQNSSVSWWAFDMGFTTPSSATTAVKSAVGQSFVGIALQGNTRVAAGFLADTLLQGTVVAVNEPQPNPLTFALSQNYPNPFNPSTTIRFAVPTQSHVTLTVYNILGQLVQTLVDEEMAPGVYNERLEAHNLSSGMYFYTMRARQTDGGQAGTFVQTRKLMVLR